jgi:hypothetical protein
VSTPAAGPRAPFPTRTWLSAAVVAVAAAAAFGSSLRAWFIGDDFGLIKALHDKPALHFFTLFTGTWTDGVFGVRPDELRPFVALSYQLDMWGGVTNPLPYHLGSIAYHVLCSLLVFALARVAVRAPLPAALYAGLLFAWHPAHAETVAWISGRADSVPTLFYLGALLAYAVWRDADRPAWYAAALLAAFCAHFSKQSAITLPVVLLAYELLQEPRGRTLDRRLLPVLPFVAITASYLGLRQVLFGNYVREQMWSLGMIRTFLRRQPAYIDALLTPGVVPVEDVTRRGLVLLAAVVVATLLIVWIRQRAPERSRTLDALLLFGPVWYVVTVGPLAVTYFSPRHLYLTSAGLALALTALAVRLTDGRKRPVRVAVGAAAVALLAGDLVALQQHNRYWNDAARASQALGATVLRTAQAAPHGSLVVVDAPWRTRQAFVWGWALPFAAQPPFAPEDLTWRVGLLGHHWTHCCPQDQWLADARHQLATWSEPQPVFVVALAEADLIVRTCSDADAPGVRAALRKLPQARSPAEAEQRLQAALQAAAPALARAPR